KLQAPLACMFNAASTRRIGCPSARRRLCGPFADHSEAPVGAIFLSSAGSPIAWPNQSRRLSLCVGRAAAVPSFPSGSSKVLPVYLLVLHNSKKSP
ncbi:hypothetical protein PRIPAC_82208, partial [Pristionchus pacificus]|uniref:Uncharacterized protein n=1 Tax=Pristionchus pacificus TaxID=54126 RepID=A0A2A6CL31_PRIPA